MCELKRVLVFVGFSVAESLRNNWIHKEKKVWQQSKNKFENPCEIDYEAFGLNADCYYFLNEDILGCNSSIYFGKKTMRKVPVVDLRYTFFQKTKKVLLKNWHVVKKLVSESKALKNFNLKKIRVEKNYIQDMTRC